MSDLTYSTKLPNELSENLEVTISDNSVRLEVMDVGRTHWMLLTFNEVEALQDTVRAYRKASGILHGTDSGAA